VVTFWANDPVVVTLYAKFCLAGDQVSVLAAALLALFITPELRFVCFIRVTLYSSLGSFVQSASTIDLKYDDSNSETKLPDATPFGPPIGAVAFKA
jgi:hypothetical protein